jgi:hypothetical protein
MTEEATARPEWWPRTREELGEGKGTRQMPANVSKVDDLLARIRAGMKEHHRLGELYRAQDKSDPDWKLWETREAYWEQKAAYERYKAIQEEAANAFGRINGWRNSDRCCGPCDLGRPSRRWWYLHAGGWLDHPLYYKVPRQDGKRGWVNAAIVGQPYDGAMSCAAGHLAVLIRAGYELHVPPEPFASIWNPGATFFLVLTLPGVVVNWLPEQRIAGTWDRDSGWREEALKAVAELREIEVGCDRDKVEWIEGHLVRKDRDDAFLDGLGLKAG